VNSPAFGGLYRGKSGFITGYTGFTGAWLAEWLLALGARVHGYALESPTEPALFQQLGLTARLQHELGDVRDAAGVRQSIA
jgi:CDP-glucose 4,6-dehydratase